MRTRSAADQRDFVTALYYGDGGTGKTTDLAFMANLGRVLYFDVEGGLKAKALRIMAAEQGRELHLENLEIFEVDASDRLCFRTIENAFWQLKAELEDDPNSWVGVVWDSGSEIYRVLLDAIVEARAEKAAGLIKRGVNVPEAMADRFYVDRDNYGVMTEQMRLLLRRFRDLPCHFASAWLERRDQDDRSRQISIGPSVTPALQGDIVGYHDLVCRTTVADTSGQLTYLGTFFPEGVRRGKDRFKALPPRLVDPTFDRIVAYINGELSVDSDPMMANYKEAKDTTAGGTTKPTTLPARKVTRTTATVPA